jgi:hypothetical protein
VVDAARGRISLEDPELTFNKADRGGITQAEDILFLTADESWEIAPAPSAAVIKERRNDCQTSGRV